jgi:hypothetical protein
MMAKIKGFASMPWNLFAKPLLKFDPSPFSRIFVGCPASRQGELKSF